MNKNKIKVEIILAKSKKKWDKRETIKLNENKRVSAKFTN
jgi:tmRNA-binding protein